MLWGKKKSGESGKLPLLRREPEGWRLEGLGTAANTSACGEPGHQAAVSLLLPFIIFKANVPVSHLMRIKVFAAPGGDRLA